MDGGTVAANDGKHGAGPDKNSTSSLPSCLITRLDTILDTGVYDPRHTTAFYVGNVALVETNKSVP